MVQCLQALLDGILQSNGGSYRMGFRGNGANSIRYLWSADSVLIGVQPDDAQVTNTFNVIGTGRFTGAVTTNAGFFTGYAGDPTGSGLTGGRHYQWGYQSPGAWAHPTQILYLDTIPELI